MKNVISKEYLDLIRRFPLRPIRSERDLDRATAVIHELVLAEKRSPEATDYLIVLSDLVESYETEHHPIPDASPAEMLAFLIEDRHTNQRQVGLGSGIPVSSISEIVNGRREMTLEQMKKLGAFFGVSAGLFMPKAESRKPVARRG